MTSFLPIAVLAVAAILGFFIYRHFATGKLAGFNDKRRASSRMVGLGEFVDGNRHLQVALAVTQDTFFYENADMQASIDLQFVREIEYDNELATGTVPAAGKVLRLRSKSQSFEFIIPADLVAKWHLMLPPRRTSETALGLPQVVPAT
jgi:hypothetical protein